MLKVINGVKYYPVSERILFGLESMIDKCSFWLTCERENFTTEQLDEIDSLRDECYRLYGKARSGWLSGKDYGKAKEITVKREAIRYSVCINAGMDEKKASMAFM